MSGKKKLLKATGIILVLLMLVGMIALISLTVFSYNKNEPPEVFGYRIYTVKDSQLDIIGENYALLVTTPDPEYLSVGNAIVYLPEGETVLKIARIDGKIENGIIPISDDRGLDTEIYTSDYYYKVDYHIKELGYAIAFIMSPFGVMIIALVPCVLIVFVELIKLIRKKADEPEVIPIVKEEVIEDELEDVLYTSKNVKKPVRERSIRKILDENENEKPKLKYTLKKSSVDLLAEKTDSVIVKHSVKQTDFPQKEYYFNSNSNEKAFFDENAAAEIVKKPVKPVDEFDVESILADLENR